MNVHAVRGHEDSNNNVSKGEKIKTVVLVLGCFALIILTSHIM